MAGPSCPMPFYRPGQVYKHAVVITDVSEKGWRAMHNEHAAWVLWTEPHLPWDPNCL